MAVLRTFSKKKDLKQKKPKADLSDTGVVNDQGFTSLNDC